MTQLNPAPAPRLRALRTLQPLLLAAALATGSAAAQTWPSRPITLLMPLAAGSAGDVALRVVAQKMGENMKTTFVLENLPGAAGLLGTERIARAPADGYLIGGIGDSILNYAANLAPKLSFDPVNDLEAVALVATIPWTLVVNPTSGAKSLSEFVARARANPGKIDYASTGTGSASHIGMELIALQTGIKLTHIPYKGATPAVNDVVGGQVPAVFSAVSVVLPFIKSGRLVALGIPAERRSALLPDVPTFAEVGVPNFQFVTWVGTVAPKGTPRPIVDRLNAETARALADPAVRDRLLGLGLEPRSTTPAELGEMIRSGHARIGKVIRDNNIKAD